MILNNHAKFETFSTAILKVIPKGTQKSRPMNKAFLSSLEIMVEMSEISGKVKFSKLFLKKHPMGY